MHRSTSALVLAACLAGCGAFLGAGAGEEAEDDDPTTATADASADGMVDGGGDSSVSITDDGGGSPDATKDARADADAGTPDACNGRPACERYVFVTSATFAGSFGAANANEECRKLADAQESVTALKGRAWRAWISTSAKSAKENLEIDGMARYKRVDGATIATVFADFTNGPLANPINRDEKDTVVNNARVWTASGSNGGYIASGCDGFTNAASGSAKVGDTGATNGAWSDWDSWSCADVARLYCFEY